MKKPTYQNAINWIALNDEPNCLNPRTVSQLISVVLVAAIFGATETQVAYDVLSARIAEAKVKVRARMSEHGGGSAS